MGEYEYSSHAVSDTRLPMDKKGPRDICSSYFDTFLSNYGYSIVFVT